MTSGPDHYRRAEMLLDLAYGAWENLDEASAANNLAAAQVHATLALTAATATQLTAQFIELDDDAFAWNEAAGTPPRRIEDVHLP